MKLLSKLCLMAAVIISPYLIAAEGGLNVSATKITSGFYMLEGVGGFVGGNMGLFVGDDGVILIDDALPTHIQLIKKAIKTVTNKPIDFLINTHIHADHIGNNEILGSEGAHIVAHENILHDLLKEGMPRAKGKAVPKAALPQITFSHSMNFHLNGNETYVFHVPQAHTNGDAVIYFKDINILHTGDTLFNGMFPYIDFARGGTLEGYISAQKKILTLINEQTKIIPGHGKLADKQDLESSIKMLEDAKKLIKALISQGKTEDEVMQLNPLLKYHDKWNWSFITTQKMTRQVYQGIKKQ